jgi:hypothetical protein
MSILPATVRVTVGATYFVDTILKAAKPADLLIEQLGISLVVNLKAAKQIGLTLCGAGGIK